MTSLADIGLGEELAEVALTTFRPDGRPHASTMGVRASGDSKILLRIFTDTDTFQNISENRSAVVNIVGDAELLARLALKNILKFDESNLEFGKSGKLDDASAWVKIEVEELHKEKISDELGTAEVAHVTAVVREIDVKDPDVRPLKRGESPVIESAVLATRIRVALDNGKQELARDMLNKLAEHRDSAAPGSSDSRLIAEISNSLEIGD